MPFVVIVLFSALKCVKCGPGEGQARPMHGWPACEQSLSASLSLFISLSVSFYPSLSLHFPPVFHARIFVLPWKPVRLVVVVFFLPLFHCCLRSFVTYSRRKQKALKERDQKRDREGEGERKRPSTSWLPLLLCFCCVWPLGTHTQTHTHGMLAVMEIPLKSQTHTPVWTHAHKRPLFVGCRKTSWPKGCNEDKRPKRNKHKVRSLLLTVAAVVVVVLALKIGRVHRKKTPPTLVYKGIIIIIILKTHCPFFLLFPASPFSNHSLVAC